MHTFAIGARIVRASIAVVAVQRRTRNAVACLAGLRTVASIPVIAVEGIVQASADGITAVIGAGITVVAVRVRAALGNTTPRSLAAHRRVAAAWISRELTSAVGAYRITGAEQAVVGACTTRTSPTSSASSATASAFRYAAAALAGRGLIGIIWAAVAAIRLAIFVVIIG